MPGIENGDAVGHHHCLLAVVCDVHRSNAEILLQGLDLVPDFLANARIEVGKRLVE